MVSICQTNCMISNSKKFEKILSNISNNISVYKQQLIFLFEKVSIIEQK